MKLNIKFVSVFVVIYILTVIYLPLNVSAQTNANQDLYLNKIGFCDVEVGYDIHVTTDYAYLSNNDGLMIIDISDPENPVKASELLIDDGAFGFVIEGDMAYIAADSSGLVIADISDPLNPQLIGQYIDGSAYTITVLDSRAYVSYMGSGFKVFDVSDPSDPNPIGEFSDTRSDGIEIKENTVYFANANSGLKVVDVSNPNTPQYVGLIPQTDGATGIFIENNKLFLACHQNGIRVLDISTSASTSVQVLDSYVDNDGGEVLGLVKQDNFLYVADNFGIELFEVDDNYSITKLAENRDFISAAHEIDVDDEYIYVALGGGLLILEINTTPETGIGGFNFFALPVLLIVVSAMVSITYYKINPKKKLKE